MNLCRLLLYWGRLMVAYKMSGLHIIATKRTSPIACTYDNFTSFPSTTLANTSVGHVHDSLSWRWGICMWSASSNDPPGFT